jgi:hypothetical protein
MKLKSLFILGLSTLALASCNQDFNDWTNQSTNTQGDAVKFGNGSVSEVDVINMANVPDGTDSIKVCNITAPTSTYSTTANSYFIYFDEGKSAYKIDNQGRMKYSDFKTYTESTYGKRPVERDMAATITAYTGDGKTAVKSIIAKSETFQVKAIPVSPYIDANGYYIVGSLDEWTTRKVDAWHLVNSGVDVYADPVFSVTIPAPAYADKYEIKIAPSSAWDGSTDEKVKDWSNVLSATSNSPATSYTGNVSYTNAGGNITFAGDKDAKFYVITINVIDGTYKVDPVTYPTYMYEIGNNTGWSSVQALYSPKNDGIYTGAFYLKSGFKFRNNHYDWNGYYNLGWNASKEEGVIYNSGSSNNIELSSDGFYLVTVDITKMTYTLLPFTNIGIIGDAQGSWDNSTEMKYDETNKCWYINGIKLIDGSIKFRSDNNWNGVNMGGDITKLDQGGFSGNIKVTAGTYNIKLYLESDVAPHATLELVK